MKRVALGVVLLLVTGCVQTWGTRADPPAAGEHAYRFLHHETTGQMDYIMVNGKEIPVEFSDDSDPRALALLKGLKPEIFVPNTSGENNSGGVYLVGRYEQGYSLSARLSQLLGDDGYHSFTLKRWYVARPILEEVSGQDMMSVKLVKLDHLRKSDFEGVTPTDAELAALLQAGG